MKNGIIIGSILIVAGIGLFAYYDQFVRYEREAQELLTEAKLVFERGTGSAINSSINQFSRIIARYPGTKAEAEACFYIAQGYEILNLNRLAYLKYVYILKNNGNLPESLESEVKARLARLKVMKRYSEEGIHQLLSLLNDSHNRDFRGRIYTELGHTYLKMTDYRKSKRMFDIALAENGDNEEAILGKARACKRLGQVNEAYDLYEFFFRYYGNFSHYADDVRRSYIKQVYSSGHESFRKGRYYPAISFFNRILRHFPEHRKSENCYYWIGECYLAMGKYDSAVSYFGKAIDNPYPHKDQDARIKRGYAYFLSKRFDLAAREFQLYMNAFPHGRHIATATKWKEMSTKEILYRIQNKMLPDTDEGKYPDEDEGGDGEEKSDKNGTGRDEKVSYHDDRVITGDYHDDSYDDSHYENVAEL